jgi:hypothetical protein
MNRKLIVYFRMKILDSDEDDSRPKRIIYAEKRAEELAEKSKERRFFVYIYLFLKLLFILFSFLNVVHVLY